MRPPLGAPWVTHSVSPGPFGKGDGLAKLSSRSSCGDRAAETVTYTTSPSASARPRRTM
jgi:hypothetical protein